MSLARGFFAILAAAAALGCVPESDSRSRLDSEQLVVFFDEVAFGNQFDPRRRPGRIRKWTSPIRISVSGEGSASFRSAVAGFAAELARLTKLSIALVESAAQGDANFQIRFVDWDDMEKEARAFAPQPDWLPIVVEGAACLFVYRRAEDYRIVQALVLVSTRESAAHKTGCLLEEMTQSLGLPNDSDALRPSIFNRYDRLTTLTPADKLLLQTLYDPRIAPGMPRAEALARAREIMRELRTGRGARSD